MLLNFQFNLLICGINIVYPRKLQLCVFGPNNLKVSLTNARRLWLFGVFELSLQLCMFLLEVDEWADYLTVAWRLVGAIMRPPGAFGTLGLVSGVRLCCDTLTGPHPHSHPPIPHQSTDSWVRPAPGRVLTPPFLEPVAACLLTWPHVSNLTELVLFILWNWSGWFLLSYQVISSVS